MNHVELSEIAAYVDERISSDAVSLEHYVTTDSLLQNKAGREQAQNMPPNKVTLIKYQPGDVLVANIRPYLRKIWQADCSGGCSADVLAFRARPNHSPDFLYAVLMQDAFFDHVMAGKKGAKMPRGDKKQIMRYLVPDVSADKEQQIGQMMASISQKISLNQRLNDNLESMAQALYDYWFVQFDFPDENGKPYKSSGGKMVWNEVLKREIPEGWSARPLFDVASVLYGYPFKTELFTENSSDLPIVRIRDILENTFSAYSREPIHEKYLTHRGDLLIGMDGNFHLNYWHRDGDGVNQRVVRIRSSAPTVSNIQLKLELTPYIKMREANVTRSTVGHLSDKDFKERYILVAAESAGFNPAKVLDALLDRMTSLVAETQKLAKQRDFLLPLLMNGQVQVKPQGVNYHLSAD